MTSKVILGHPYSGALYGYFSDQIGGAGSHRRTANNNSYYKTIYGKTTTATVNLSLNFLLLHDEVWVAPADNHWPISRRAPDDSRFHWELGLHADWDDFHGFDYAAAQRYVEELVLDPRVQASLGQNGLKIPRHSWSLVVRYALYEAGLSARKRIPILCSPGRRNLIMALINIQRPSLHPQFVPNSQVSFVERYRTFSGLALAPKSLDDLMDAKPDTSVRKYGSAFVSALVCQHDNSSVSDRDFALAALAAIETERVSKLWSGALKWASNFLRFIHEPILAGGAAATSYFAGLGAEAAGWYEFKGSIDTAISKAELVRRLEEAVERAGDA